MASTILSAYLERGREGGREGEREREVAAAHDKSHSTKEDIVHFHSF